MNVNGLFWEFEFYRLSYVLCFLSVGSGVTAGESLNSISVDLIAPSHYFFSHIHGWDIEFVVGLFFGGVLLRDSVFFCCLLFVGRRFGVFRSVFWGEFCYIVSRAVIICWLCWLDVWLVAIHEFVYCRAVNHGDGSLSGNRSLQSLCERLCCSVDVYAEKCECGKKFHK